MTTEIPAQLIVGMPGVGVAGHTFVRRPWGWGWGGWGGYTRESPSQEVASMIEAVGNARESRSRAILNYADAQRQYIENAAAWNKFYNDRRDAYKARQSAAYEAEREEVQRYVANKHLTRPPRLTSAQLDSYAGSIHWPSALMGVEFELRRARLEGLLASRAQTGSTPELALEIRTAARALQSDLRDHINEYTTRPNDYLAARKFLESLALEGEYTVE